MAALEAGTWAWLFYDGDDVWHTRLIVGWVQDSQYIVFTPDFDTFIEEISIANADLTGLRIGDTHYQLPVGIAADGVYAFNPALTPADIARLCTEGARSAAAERQQRGLAAGIAPAAGAVAALAPGTPLIPLPVPVAGVPLGPRLAGPLGAWVLDEPSAGDHIGREIVLPPGALDFGGRAFVRVNQTLVSVTLVPPATNLDEWASQQRARLCLGDPRISGPYTTQEPVTLAAAHAAMKPDPSFDPIIAGPSTVHASLASSLEHSAGGLLSSHDKWVVESGIEPKHRSVFEHKVLSRAIQIGYSIDGLNVKNLHSFEYLNRRRQLLEEAHKNDPKKHDLDGSDYFMGEVDAVAGVHVTASLRKHVADEFAKQAALDKERRKAKEAKKH